MPTLSPFCLDGKIVIVTGAGRGIGRSIAGHAAAAGADLVLGSRTVPELEALAQELKPLDRRIACLPLDVTSLASIRAFTQAALDHFGQIDVLVNNAGTNRIKPALEITEEDWDLICDTNLKGCFFMSQEVGRHMVERRSGAIVNISSQAGLVGGPQRVPYSGAKGGVVNMTRALAVEWASYGVRVNGIAPTVTRTPLAEQAMQNPQFREMVLRSIPLGRLAEPDEIALAVVFLASDAARMITGQTLAVDGGWTAV
ncbi:MAG: SDR family oxidoreductase [Armatimonadetes bacterium]|nr:SDR family oxidoreductase [Armatimonadota bacterium]